MSHRAQRGIAFVAWLPVAPAAASRRATAVARRLGVSPAQVALAWLLHRSPVTLPIPGTTSGEHLADNVAAARLSLDPATLAELDVYKN